MLAVARNVLIEDGLERFVLRTIASRAGMRLGNLQYYFATRDDLLEAVIRAEFDRDLAIIHSTLERSRSPGDALPKVAHGLVCHWCDGGSVYAALWLLAYHHERFRDLNRQIYETFYGELALLIRSADPRASDAELDIRTRLVTSVLDGVAIQTHADVESAHMTCDDLLEHAGVLVLQIASGRATDGSSVVGP